ncbi:unnamed protein product [Cuscuta epithymum]|uniref:NmrA-like domain-containing protein n=1 Tax=Cuscuta epithymum TaxID=186058 RepID=A0AAV0DKP2_9ASTE|nr:unnamed protein product [Cuscuta epithymum]
MASTVSFTLPLSYHNLPRRLLPPLVPLNSPSSGYKIASNSKSLSRISNSPSFRVYAVTEHAAAFPPASSSSKVVLVVGGTGGVGQLIVASLLNQSIRVRLILRDLTRASALFGKQNDEKLHVWKADTRNRVELDPSMFEGVTHAICCTGTTAFPSRRWAGDNTPERVASLTFLGF